MSALPSVTNRGPGVAGGGTICARLALQLQGRLEILLKWPNLLIFESS